MIYEASGGLLDTSVALAFSRKPVAIWGHIADYTKAPSRVDVALESWQLRRAKVVFAYTDRGRQVAIDRGASADKVRALNNTIETAGLLTRVRSLDAAQADQILGGHRLDPSTTFSYIGGVDGSKRIDFLVQALDLLWRRGSPARLYVGGTGTHIRLFDEAVSRGQVILLGPVGDEQKAALAHRSRALLMPGRVGLVAVESLALDLPILTTDWPFHAPEFDYLVPGKDVVLTPDDVDAYVDEITRMIENTPQPDVSSRPPLTQAPDLAHMVSEFVTGTLQLLDGRPTTDA